MRYGSSLLIEIRELWSDKPLFSEVVTLSRSPNSDGTLKEILGNIVKWYNNALINSEIGKNLTDEQLLNLAIARGLVPYNTPTNLPELYFIETRSGKTKGHYIELYKDNTVKCSCPGFVNNGKCWASSETKSFPADFINDKWAASRAAFYRYRNEAYPSLID